jgi:hypothetical protein
METRPFDTPRKGMIVFSKDARLMATIEKAKGSAFDFWVHNGAWAGSFSDGKLHIVETGATVSCEGFEEVVRLTPDEIGSWYLDGVRGVSRLLAGRPSDPRIVEQAIAEKDLDSETLAEKALEFIEGRNLSGAFAEFLTEQPEDPVDEDDFENEIAF